jgi:outer membrane receptor protein involved in Fe transport
MLVMYFLLVAAIFVTLLPSGAKSNDKEVFDTLKSVTITSSSKQPFAIEKIASPVSTIFLKDIEQRGLRSPKYFSSIIPNLFIPDYGSSMTSTIYIRGFGSRIDNPVMGLYIDDIPVLDKNNYDFDLSDIKRADFFHGPQGTLYGSNSMCGMLSLTTLSPADVSGSRIRIEYGSGNDILLKGSTYKGNVGITASYRHSDGFYKNTYNGKDCDGYDGLSFRFKYLKKINDRLSLENILSASALKQGGYPYRQFVTGNEYEGKGEEAYGGYLLPINYNDTCSYRRFNLTEGLKVNYKSHNLDINTITSIQLLSDKMHMDQDFTDASMFTLMQKQNEQAVTQETIIKPVIHPEWWNSQSGFFGSFKHNKITGPVRFKKDGIQTLILDNANANIPESIGQLAISDNNFLISSVFGINTCDLALYHESYFTFGKWLLTAGLRVDYEYGHMSYDCGGTIHYKFMPIMTEFKPFDTIYNGDISNSYLQLVPKVSALYDFGKGLKAFGIISNGYKSGGFNTQIFSDILQSRMMNGLMSDLGVYLDNAGDMTAKSTTYKPETNINYEVGIKYSRYFGATRKLDISASAFRIDAKNQQITIFPPGKSTGRMMANAGKSMSCGTEAEIKYTYGGFTANASYGFTDASFTEYNDGNEDYKGKTVPYSPENTLYIRGSYRYSLKGHRLHSICIGGDYNGAGRIQWNTSNTISQPFYGLLGTDISFSFGKYELYARADNLTDKDYDTFYFKSVGKEFFERGKPFRFTIGFYFDI